MIIISNERITELMKKNGMPDCDREKFNAWLKHELIEGFALENLISDHYKLLERIT